MSDFERRFEPTEYERSNRAPHAQEAALHAVSEATPDQDNRGEIEFAPKIQAPELRIVPVADFVAVEEEGAAAILGGEDGDALIPEAGDVMIYGDGGAGKTTLAIDLGCHLAAGDDWLGIPVQSPARVLLIENEGPRPQFRAKLRRKTESWAGAAIKDRIQVLEEPWSMLTLADGGWRGALATAIADGEIDVVILGPVTRAGMNEAGTLQEVRDFMVLVADVRQASGRPVAFVLVHHENKNGKVSGAWEGAGDTLLHIQGQGHARIRCFIQKARWASAYHGTALQLAWAEGEGFELVDDPKRDGDAIAGEILEAVKTSPGASWGKIDQAVSGKADRKRKIRDELLAGGRLVDVGGKGGMQLWHADDPAVPREPRPGWDGVGTGLQSAPGEAAETRARPPVPPMEGTEGTGRGAVPPDEVGEDELDYYRSKLAEPPA